MGEAVAMTVLAVSTLGLGGNSSPFNPPFGFLHRQSA